MPAEMTSRERILTALRHEEPDRVPVAPRASKFLFEHYGRDEPSWKQYPRAAEEFGWDTMVSGSVPIPNLIGTVPLKGYEILEPDVRTELEVEEDQRQFTVKRRFHTPTGTLSDVVVKPKPDKGFGISPNPRFTETLFKGREDLGRLRYLFPDPSRARWESFHRIKDAYTERDGLVAFVVRGPFDQKGGDAWALEEMMLAYYDDRQLFRDYLRLFFEQCMVETRAVLEQGAEILHCSWFYHSLSSGWSPQIYRDEFAPLIKQQVDLVHGHGAIFQLYDDGKLMPNLETLRDCGVDILTTITPPPMGDFDLASAKASIGKDVALSGYVDHMNVIAFGTPELVAGTVRDAIRIGAPGGGFILGTSDSMQNMAPLGNVVAFSDAARLFGRYPISA
jgi:uroporphyrinogen decarboxylase